MLLPSLSDLLQTPHVRAQLTMIFFQRQVSPLFHQLSTIRYSLRQTPCSKRIPGSALASPVPWLSVLPTNPLQSKMPLSTAHRPNIQPEMHSACTLENRITALSNGPRADEKVVSTSRSWHIRDSALPSRLGHSSCKKARRTGWS